MIVQNIQQARLEACLTQSQLAQLLGVDTDYVEMLEAGQWKPSWMMALKLAETLHVSVDLFSQSPTEKEECST